jgi:hypothetical protein
MDHSEEIYKMKYLKYKFKYLQLKDELEGGTYFIKGLTRMVKRAVNSEEDKQKIRLKINEIIVKHDLFARLQYLGNRVVVDRFLENVKKLKTDTNKLLKIETDSTKKEDLKKKIEDLEYIEANQFYCKGHSVDVYDNAKKCFDNNPYKDMKI